MNGLKGKRILIYGLGRSGRGVARFLHGEGVQADWIDARPAEEDLALMKQLGYPAGEASAHYDLVIAAPGVPIDHADLVTLQAGGAEVIGEVVLAARLRPELPMVGVTGTAGKGGTTVLIAHLLRACGVSALEGGNIDPPLLDVVDRAEVAVVELSSFQLERVPGLRLPIAVITNLGADHLDRHGSIAAYHAAKWNITAGQHAEDVLVLPADLAGTLPTQAQRRPFNAQNIVLANGREVLAQHELPEGLHPANAAAAVLATEAMLQQLKRPVSAEVLAQALRTAQPVAGRFETVARCGQVRFVDDSIATRTLAVQAALERAVPPVAWLVGGRDKGAELQPLIQAAQGKVLRVIAFGEDGETFARQLGFPYEVAAGEHGDEILRNAVEAAYRSLADASKGTVLLAPIGTSFDLFKDYKARGDSFKQAAEALCALQDGHP